MSAILKFDFQKENTITFFWSKVSKLHEKDQILHVTTTFSLKQGETRTSSVPIPHSLTLKEPGYFDPSHSRRGADSAPLKISETDRWNIKCVVLVDSYDPPESIGTTKFKTYLVWRHSDVISDVMSKTRKSPKIAKIMVFLLFFQAKVAFFSNDVCQSMLTHVPTPNKPNK